jgi:hypothetical protein
MVAYWTFIANISFIIIIIIIIFFFQVPSTNILFAFKNLR